jgi:hypothetical protein
MGTVTDWTARSYVRRFDYIALQDGDTCRPAVLGVCVPAASDYGAVRSVKIGDGITKQIKHCC